jgi:hypothetical protein
LFLLFFQSGIRKHSGTSAWLLAFTYICGLVSRANSTNQNARFSTEAPFLQQLLSGKRNSRCAFSRFLSKPFPRLRFSSGRLAVLKNGLKYPMLWRFRVKAGQENERQTKLDLAKRLLSEYGN